MSELERIVGDLREDVAALDADMRHLSPAVVELTQEVKKLTEALNKSKGAAWMLTLLGGGLGAGLFAIVEWLRGLRP